MHKNIKKLLTWKILPAILLTSIFLLTSCRSDSVKAPQAARSINQETAPTVPWAVSKTISELLPSPTPTVVSTLRPTSTSTATATPSATPTPTPTAVPITISGNPRESILNHPEPQENARCGIVDLLDFPLDPPDALNVSYGGQGYGRFRSRYDQYHAGEDWQLVRGRSNLGVPVYAIGHGRVTYAQPLGWGRDQGVVIIRHTFSDFSTVLSFYGHLEPDSVTLRAGDCVERGQKIAEIGQPRTPPHLHFEIRTHLPDEPGPGYWPTDPSEAGWLPPSQFIWNNRIASIPGVMWTRPSTTEGLDNIELVEGNTLIARDGTDLIGLNTADGRLLWRQSITETTANALVNSDQSLLYTADWHGQATAYVVSDTEDGTTTLSEDPLWQVDLRMVGSPTLLPLPEGGMAVSVRDDLTAVSANGGILWREKLEERPSDWLLLDDQLVVTVSGREGPIYSASPSGLQEWPIPLTGRPFLVGEQIWLYANEGLYRLDPTTRTAELLYKLPLSFVELGSMIALPGGGAIIAHRERNESRLIAFNAGGTVQWQRSYAQLGTGRPLLLLHNDRPYLLYQSGNNSTTQQSLFAIDRQSSILFHIFSGGTRTPLPGKEWFVSVNDGLLLINVGGGSMAALDPEAAVSLLIPSME